MPKTHMWLCGALLALAACAAEKTREIDDTPDNQVVNTPPPDGEAEFDLFEFLAGDEGPRDTAAMNEAVVQEWTAGDDDAPVAARITLFDVDELDDPAASTPDIELAAAEEPVSNDQDDTTVQEPVAVRIEPLEVTDETESIVVGEDLVVHVVPVAAPREPSAGPTVTLANSQSAPVPAAVFNDIQNRLQKAGFGVVPSSDGDYLVICGRIPPRTMWGRSTSSGAPDASYVRAMSLAEPLGVRLDRPGGGAWQAIVEIAFELDDYDQRQLLRLREIHTIYSGDIRKVRRRDPARLARLNEALDAWASAYGTGVAVR